MNPNQILKLFLSRYFLLKIKKCLNPYFPCIIIDKQKIMACKCNPFKKLKLKINVSTLIFYRYTDLQIKYCLYNLNCAIIHKYILLSKLNCTHRDKEYKCIIPYLDDCTTDGLR